MTGGGGGEGEKGITTIIWGDRALKMSCHVLQVYINSDASKPHNYVFPNVQDEQKTYQTHINIFGSCVNMCF